MFIFKSPELVGDLRPSLIVGVCKSFKV